MAVKRNFKSNNNKPLCQKILNISKKKDHDNKKRETKINLKTIYSNKKRDNNFKSHYDNYTKRRNPMIKLN